MDEIDLRLEKYRSDMGGWRAMQQQKLREADEADKHAKMIEQRIAGIMEAMALLTPTPPIDVQPFIAKAEPAIRRRQRSLTGHWQQIMQLVDEIGDFSYDDLTASAEAVGHEVVRDSLRAQMSQYKASGLVESVGDARFRMTAAGRQAAGIKPSSEADASNENEASVADAADASDASQEGGTNASGSSDQPIATSASTS